MASVGHADPGPVGQTDRARRSAVAAGHHQVGVAPVDGSDQVGNGLRRMLEVSVHHHDHPAHGQSQACNDRAAEAADPLAGPPVHGQHRDRAVSAMAAMTSGVSSVLSSTKMTSACPAGNATLSRAMRGPMFSRSLRVGTTTLISMVCTLTPR